MSLSTRIPLWFRPAAYLGSNPVTLTGAVLTTSSALIFLGFWALELIGGIEIHPYAGIFFFLILPALFVLGLVLMPVGALWRRYRLLKTGQLPEIYPRIDLSQPMFRHAVGWVAVLTVVNAVIFGAASYRGVNYMDSVKFCGQTCHTVMQPEYVAYRNSPHQRVACVQCHIGPGAGWFVRSKLSGVRQVFAVTFHTYDRPIAVPVENLRPARETCEQCHWPQMFEGDKVVVRTSYSDDEKNTPLTTVLVLKLGGGSGSKSPGIHGRHLDTKFPIEYISTDRARQVIPEVTFADASGKRIEFISTDTKPTPEQLAAGEHRTMDCVDCHNRPSHTFQLPGRAVDQALSRGQISTDLPFIKKKAVEVLQADYPDRDTAAKRIAASLYDFYRTSYPDVYGQKRSEVDAAVSQVQAIYLSNVFPAMKITWGTYPNNLGHQDFPGCFRCHDGSHTSADGRTIPNDCNTCHTLLAVDEQNPKILSDLGMK
jgi:NapC/NirT cytochrome c family, N-terminal region